MVTSLVEKSLVRQGEDRFRMLETIREFALERLDESHELEQIRCRHVDFFLALAERQESNVRHQSPAGLERLDSEHDNFRASLHFARELGDSRAELRLASALLDFWEVRSHLTEGLERVREALDRDPEAPVEIRGRALKRGALIAHKQGEFETARLMVEEMRQLHAAAGDEQGLGDALHLLGIIAVEERRYDDARVLYEQGKAIRERFGDDVGLQASIHNLGLLAMSQSDYGRARAELELALAMAEKSGSEQQTANSLCDLGFAELGDGRLDQARARFGEALASAVRLGWKENVAYCLVGLGGVAVAVGELDLAGHVLGQAERLVEDLHLKLEIYAEAARVQVEAEIRSRLGEDRLEALRAEGRSLSMEAAVSEVLPALD
jgi:tetratricopeptide (TPR) repeat protein